VMFKPRFTHVVRSVPNVFLSSFELSNEIGIVLLPEQRVIEVVRAGQPPVLTP
jgi:hypothetical protein